MNNENDTFVGLVRNIVDALMIRFNLHIVESKRPEVVRYSNERISVEFYYGPPEFHVEMFLIWLDENSGRTYSLADLIRKQAINDWMCKNKLKIKSEDKMKDELDWYYRFLEECCSEALKGEEKFFIDL
jgi:hypothetical protein